MARPIRWYDYITLNIFFLGLTVLSQTNGLVFPLLVQLAFKFIVRLSTKGKALVKVTAFKLIVAPEPLIV
jgi:hypothetical protein